MLSAIIAEGCSLCFAELPQRSTDYTQGANGFNNGQNAATTQEQGASGASDTDILPSKIQVLPAGPEIKGIDGRSWTLTDAQALADSLNGMKRHFVIDLNHATFRKGEKGEDSPAMGWMTRFFVDSGHLWADVEWTPRGAEVVRGKEYKYTSPTLLHDRSGNITGLAGSSLVNYPTLTMQALCSASGISPDVIEAGGINETLISELSALRAQNNAYAQQHASFIKEAVGVALLDNCLPRMLEDTLYSHCAAHGIDAMRQFADSLGAVCGVPALRQMQTVSLGMSSEELRRQHREKLSPEGREVCETLGVDPSRLAEINHNKKG
ncbi:hypothetical protein M8Y12_004247 [Salmonella enterica]|nr:hypothetical protein [Salmonella enterica]EJF6355395.1 hypothetical protein [Salmonella enterica]ELG0646470.1 hypothetical protein [Salmonella enterica]